MFIFFRSKAANKSKQTSPSTNPNIDVSKVFCQYDIIETSLHLQISVLNIHLYADDNYSGNPLIDGVAMQVFFKNLCIDHCPYHKTSHSVKHWNKYNHVFMQREDWSKAHINEFIDALQTILNSSKSNECDKS